jgi:hypothetical protein
MLGGAFMTSSGFLLTTSSSKSGVAIPQLLRLHARARFPLQDLPARESQIASIVFGLTDCPFGFLH